MPEQQKLRIFMCQIGTARLGPCVTFVLWNLSFQHSLVLLSFLLFHFLNVMFENTQTLLNCQLPIPLQLRILNLFVASFPKLGYLTRYSDYLMFCIWMGYLFTLFYHSISKTICHIFSKWNNNELDSYNWEQLKISSPRLCHTHSCFSIKLESSVRYNNTCELYSIILYLSYASPMLNSLCQNFLLLQIYGYLCFFFLSFFYYEF